MARKPTKTATESDTKPDVFLKELNERLGIGEWAFELSGPITVPVCQNDQFKTKALAGNEEFIVKSARRGGKGQIIFSCVPLDSQPYETADFAEKVAPHALIGFDVALGNAFGFTDLVLHGHEPDILWQMTKDLYDKNLALKEEKEAREAKEEQDKVYATNSTWGMF